MYADNCTTCCENVVWSWARKALRKRRIGNLDLIRKLDMSSKLCFPTSKLLEVLSFEANSTPNFELRDQVSNSQCKSRRQVSNTPRPRKAPASARQDENNSDADRLEVYLEWAPRYMIWWSLWRDLGGLLKLFSARNDSSTRTSAAAL